jgi:hypothetical protein
MPFYLTPAGKIAVQGGLPVSLTQAEFELCCCEEKGACCKNGITTCVEKTENDCQGAYGGQWQGAGSKCTPVNPCLKWQCWTSTFSYHCTNSPHPPTCFPFPHPSCPCQFYPPYCTSVVTLYPETKNVFCNNTDISMGSPTPDFSTLCYRCTESPVSAYWIRCFRGCPTTFTPPPP